MRIVAGRVLVEALVWPVVVEVAYVLVEDGAGVLFVVDQRPVGAFFTDAADESFCIAVGSRCAGRDLDYVEPFGDKDSIEAVGELGVRSRIRKRNELMRSSRSIRRLRAVWVVQAAVG